jgi:hypothetical protein
MGMMKKAVRRATPRPVRKAKAVVRHPVGTATRAATPRSVRNAKRTAFNAIHPINTAENRIVRAAMSRKAPPQRRSRASGGNLSGSAWAAIITFSAVAVIGHGSKTAGIVGLILAVIVYAACKIGVAGGAAQPPAVGEPTSTSEPMVVLPQRITQSWIDREVPGLSDRGMEVLIATLHSRGWQDDEIAARVLTRRV